MAGPPPSSLFFLQLAVILAACRACAKAGRPLLQPPVVCEMVAGVLLGPSLLGWLAPGLSAALFPGESMPLLYAASQLGLALYMFCVGLEFRLDQLAEGWAVSAGVSLAGLLAPLACGALVGLKFVADPALFSARTLPWQAAVFTGAAMSITAFPMLARIIMERGLAGTRIGTLSLGAGAFGDLAAWLLLAGVVAAFDSEPRIAALAAGGGLLFLLFAAYVARPAARSFAARRPAEALGSPGLALALILLAASAFAADAIGLHAVFGGFALGACMPRGAYAESLRARIEPLTSALIVPLFFVYSGLNTRLDLLASPAAWGLAALVIAVATGAKGAASALAARAGGFTAAESAAVGTLMNARGLMELILLNIGLERGLITPLLFSVFVLMAVVTTLAASPVFELLRPRLTGAPAGPARSRSPVP